MLLTCPQCQNSFMIDDQVYAMQGGAYCEQCQVPLVPSEMGYGQWQQSQQMPMNQAQWGQQPMDQAQWGQQPMDQAQWGQQPMDQAQWGQQPMGDAQWGQPMDQAQWGQQPMNQAQWGQQPMGDAQWGQPMGQAQWGQQPPSDAQWGQMADAPKETVALMETVGQDDVVRHNDANERTVALSDWDGVSQVPPPPTMSMPQGNGMTGDDDWDSWGGSPRARVEEVRTADAAALGQQINPNALVVGNALPPGAHEGMTREIDARDVQSLYGDKLNPIAEFLRSIPMRYLIIAGGVLGASLVVFIIVAVVITRPPKVEQEIRNGEIVDVNAPEREKTFSEIARESISLSPSFIPFDGNLAKEGSVVGVAEDIGVYYDLNKIAEIDDVVRGGVYVEKIAAGVEDHGTKSGKPITMLFGESLPMSAVYRTMYTLGPTTRKLFIGGTTHSGISTFKYHPCGWPDHDMFIFETCKDVPIDVKITRTKVTIRRVSDAGSVPLVVLDDGTELTEVSADIIGTKVQFDGIQMAISRLSMVSGATVRFVTDGDVTFGVFMTIAQRVYGSDDKPNIKTLYLAPVPLI